MSNQKVNGQPEANRDANANFLFDLKETVLSLENSLIELENAENKDEAIDNVFRYFHNIKSSTAMHRFKVFSEIAHFAESLLSDIRSKTLTLESDHIDLFLQCTEAFKNLLKQLESEEGNEGEERYFLLLHKLVDARPKHLSDTKKQDTGTKIENISHLQESKEKKIKVDRKVIDQMMLIVTEFMLLKNQVQHFQTKLKGDNSFYDLCQELEQFSKKLQKNILELRLSPIDQVFNQMNLVVRTISKQLKKTIEFEVRGGNTLLDRNILDKLADPLTHLVRNAIDHGIESEEDRLRANKPAKGHLILKAEHRTGQVNISVNDDGAGVNTEKLRAKAISSGLMNASQAQQLSRKDLVNLIFKAGISQKDQVSEISGRGVGMDVVKSTIENIGGQIEVNTSEGSGTVFTIKLPVSLAIVECLHFKVGNQIYAIPQVNIEAVLSLDSPIVQENIRHINEDSRAYMVGNNLQPILPLDSVVAENSTVKNETLILLRHGSYRFIIEVGKVLGPVSLVSKQLPQVFVKDSLFSGVTEQGDGSLLLQIDVSKLLNYVSVQQVVKKGKSVNRGIAGNSQEEGFLTSSDVRRLQQKIITFKNHHYFCLPVQRAKHIAYIKKEIIKEVRLNGQNYVTLDGETIPLIWVDDVLLDEKRPLIDSYALLIFSIKGKSYGIPMEDFRGIKRMPEDYDSTLAEKGILGTTVIENSTYFCLDLPGLIHLMTGKNPTESDQKSAKIKKLRRVAAAEDDKYFATELISTIKGCGIEVDMYEDGLQLKTALENQDYIDQIDLIVTDIEMPNMTGLGLTKWMKANQATRHLPIIAYSAITSVEMMRKMQEAGSIAFVSKMSMDLLIDNIQMIERGELDGKNSIEETVAQSAEKIISFAIGDQWFALRMNAIMEVTAVTTSVYIPETHPWSNRITSFRGKSIPVLNVAAYFDLPSEELGKQIVVKQDDLVFTLLVDRIGEVLTSSMLDQGSGMSRLGDESGKIVNFIDSVYVNQNRIIRLFDERIIGSILELPSTNQVLKREVLKNA